MSDNIPFEIQIEIMKKLPIKSLIQFRSVSKSWKSLIDSSDFIAHYRTHMQHLLASYTVAGSFDRQYVSFVDDDTFPHQTVSFHLHSFINNLNYTSIVNITHGLICLYWCYRKGCENNIIYERDMAVIWNPTIRKAVVVIVPNVSCDMYDTVFGFGVCRETNDPKIVKITCLEKYRWRFDRERSSIPWQVEVFTLSTGAWRRVCNNLPRKSIRFSCDSEVVDGVLYWLADYVDPGDRICNLIMSFDLTTEEFREVKLPESLTHPDKMLLVSKRRECLIVLGFDEGELERDFCDVWMMEDGISKSFTKLCSVNGEMYPLACIHGFRKSGEPVFQVSEGDECGEVFVYEPYSKHFDKLGINVRMRACIVSPYIETLLLLDKPDLTVYYENQIFKYRDDLFQELNLAPVDQ